MKFCFGFSPLFLRLNALCFGLCLAALPHPALADQEDRRMQLNQGLELRKQQQEQDMVGGGQITYGSSGSEESDDVFLALMKAVNAQNEAETARLLALYRKQPGHDPDMVLFVQANQAIYRNDLKEAVSLYRQVYRRNPDFLRGKLDLARLLFVDKQNKEAAALFADTAVPQVPEIDRKIESFREALANRDA